MNTLHGSVKQEIFFTKISLVDDYLPLYVPLVKGKNYSAFVDSGTKTALPNLLGLLSYANVQDKDLRFVIQTHSHADHIGCNVGLKERTNCLIAAHPLTAHWHTDPERHYQEWARSVPSLTPDTPELRRTVFDWFDTPHTLDLYVDEGASFDFGGGVVLTAYKFPGHMQNDMVWLESKTRTLLLGDAITATDWPHFHIHVNVPIYRDSLQRLQRFLINNRVETVLQTHFGAVSAEDTQTMIRKSLAMLDRIDRLVLRTVAKEDQITLKDIWTRVATTMEKTLDHHSLTSINAHVQDFLRRGLLREVGPLTYTMT